MFVQLAAGKIQCMFTSKSCLQGLLNVFSEGCCGYFFGVVLEGLFVQQPKYYSVFLWKTVILFSLKKEKYIN
jgi:hypothetical protein